MLLLRKTDVLQIRFSKFKKFVSTLVFGHLQLAQTSFSFITSGYDLKIRGLGAKVCVWFFYYFSFERNQNVLKSKKSSCILLNKSINFNKNETESKIENPTCSFGETNLVLQLI